MSGFAFYYDCVLEISDDDILRIFPPEKEGDNILNLGAKSSVPNVTAISSAADLSGGISLSVSDSNNANKNTKFILSYGDYNIDIEKKTITFPFLSNMEIEVFRMGAVQGITEDLNVEKVDYTDDNGNKKTFAAQYIAPYNCIVKMSFSIPEAISRFLPAWEWIPKILFARRITSKYLKLFPLYKSNAFSELENASIIINDLVSVDFNTEAFNPLSSSGNGNEISFTRTFAGVTQKIYKIVKTSEYQDKRRKKAIAENEEKLKNNGREITVDEVVDQNRNDNNDKINDNRNGFTNVLSSIGNEREEEKEEVGKKIPKISFVSNEIDFENIYFVEDTASESNGFLQYSALYSRMEKLHTFIPDTFDIYTSEPVFKSTKVDNGSKKVELPNQNIKESGASAQNNVANSKYIDSAIQNNPSIVGKKPDAFAMTISLPFPIANINLFDTVELTNSWLGLYDGFWKVLKINMKLDEKGFLTQQLNIIPSHFFTLASQKVEVKETKIEIKTDSQ